MSTAEEYLADYDRALAPLKDMKMSPEMTRHVGLITAAVSYYAAEAYKNGAELVGMETIKSLVVVAETINKTEEGAVKVRKKSLLEMAKYAENTVDALTDLPLTVELLNAAAALSLAVAVFSVDTYAETGNENTPKHLYDSLLLLATEASKAPTEEKQQ